MGYSQTLPSHFFLPAFFPHALTITASLCNFWLNFSSSIQIHQLLVSVDYVYAISFTGQNTFLSISISHSAQMFFFRELNTRAFQAAGVRLYGCLQCLVIRTSIHSSWNVIARDDARAGKWRGNWRMEWVASSLHITSEHGVSSITATDAHTSAASSRLNWRSRRFTWTRPFRRKTKSGFCACAIIVQLASTAYYFVLDLVWPWRITNPNLSSDWAEFFSNLPRTNDHVPMKVGPVFDWLCFVYACP
jgi:hypothetical protein